MNEWIIIERGDKIAIEFESTTAIHNTHIDNDLNIIESILCSNCPDIDRMHVGLWLINTCVWNTNDIQLFFKFKACPITTMLCAIARMFVSKAL